MVIRVSPSNDESAAEVVPREGVSKPRPRLRAAVATVLALLVVGGAGAAWFVGGGSHDVLAPPDGPWPEQRGFMVLQCSKEGLTPETQPAVERFLRALPEIESLTAYSKLQMEEGPLGTRNVCGVQAHFVGTARDVSDIPKIAEEIAKSPASVRLVRLPSNFWAGKADVRIILTGPGSPSLQLEKEGARAATKDDREIITEKIRQAVDVEKIYYEDSAFATKVNAFYCPDRLCAFDPGPVEQETLYVKTDVLGAVRTLKSTLGDVPGVEFVVPVSLDVL
ncbi:hypothetical protein [Streptosporangium carneum]|uniref:FtsX extracellular domain-containing protein n=1 Tax=Streptosporangium carneum TaxID=47481 RepID=A0A9W6I3G1_9ACTN|nr:hypothetical protein [Streptosporangium carneum]GLK10493.1 hypothetical protein GCM10017600_38990 [Streptosporangium carneum]